MSDRQRIRLLLYAVRARACDLERAYRSIRWMRWALGAGARSSTEAQALDEGTNRKPSRLRTGVNLVQHAEEGRQRLVDAGIAAVYKLESGDVGRRVADTCAQSMDDTGPKQ